MTDNVLIVFVKNPALGKVKTRLAKSVGDEAALAIYLKLLAQCYETTAMLDCDVVIYYSSYVDSEDYWDNKQYRKCIQQGSDLGERMGNALANELARGYKKACLVGSDIYELNAEIIKKAFEILDEKDTVIGPAEDGGYYLIGLKKPNPAIFEINRWSTPQVFDQTVDLMKKENLTYGTTMLLNDIDDLEDLKKAGML